MPKEERGIRYSVSVFDQNTAISQYSSINVRIKPVKTSAKHLNNPVLFQVSSHVNMCAPRWKHLLCYEYCCLIIHIQLQPFNNCLRPSHLPQHFGPHHQEATPWCDTHPWSPISKSRPFPCVDAEVEAWRGIKVARRYQGSVRWRSHEGHSSLGGWAISMGAWRAEAGLSHRPSVLQLVLQRWSTNHNQTASHTWIPTF